MKKSTVSRRKFLTGMGLATGAAALAPKLKLGSTLKSKGGLLNAWTQPASATPDIYFRSVKIRNRRIGSHLLPLDRKPF